MAVRDAVKVFKFVIEIDGVDQFMVQEKTGGDPEVGVVRHGAENYDRKTAGGYDVSPVELKSIKPTKTANTEFEDWLLTAQNPHSGTGADPEEYQRDVVFKELNPDGTVLYMELWENCWVSKVKKGTYKRGKQDENVIDTVTIQIDKVLPLGL